MTDLEAYQATLLRMKADLSRVESMADNLRAGIAAVEDIIRAVRPTPAMPGKRIGWVSGSERVPDGLTMQGLARWALQRKSPLRVREIYELLIQHGYQPTGDYERFRGSMAPTLDRMPIFNKVDKGLYEIDPREAEREKAQGADGTLGLP